MSWHIYLWELIIWNEEQFTTIGVVLNLVLVSRICSWILMRIIDNFSDFWQVIKLTLAQYKISEDINTCTYNQEIGIESIRGTVRRGYFGTNLLECFGKTSIVKS